MIDMQGLTPPKRETVSGSLRRVGVEIEFAAILPRDGARLVQARFGGEIEELNPHRFQVSGASGGTFMVELDARQAHPNEDLNLEPIQRLGREWPWLSGLADRIIEWDAEAGRLIGEAGANLIPSEIVCPPLPWTDLDDVEALYRDLEAAGASGTDDGALYAFGLHMNVETPDDTAATLLPLLQAYLLLSPWLREDIKVDPTRRIFPYIDTFPAGYLAKVCHPDYAPSLDEMIDDYLDHNATRNRELDMLPIFANLRPARVHGIVDDPRVKPRPAFHWRLPNARFGGPEAGPLAEWRRWLTVERLASDSTALAGANARYQRLADWPLSDDIPKLSRDLAARFFVGDTGA
jgi:hypothetical protein